MQVDVNCDVGEGFGAYRLGNDEAMMTHITSANVACGFHAGDPSTMDRTVRLAVRHSVQVGCHPSYPDLLGFGRRALAAAPEEVEEYVLYQLGALWAFARAHRTEVRHVKAHGALYNVAAEDREVARGIARGVARFSKEIALVCLAGSEMVAAGVECGLRVAEEVFADRRYKADGTLQSRKVAGSVIHDPEAAVNQALRLLREGAVVTRAGHRVRVRPHSICLHGDNPAGPQIAEALGVALTALGIEMKPLAEFL